MADIGINMEYSIKSGQVFLWKRSNDIWYGINGQNVLKIDDLGNEMASYRNIKTDFFRKRDDIKKILRDIVRRDKMVMEAVRRYPGLRLIEQDPWQCLISFITSARSNIPRIRQNLENMCKRFGKNIKFDGQEFFLFPEAARIADATIDEICECGVGYRSKFIKGAAEMISSKKIDFVSLKKSRNYEDVHNEMRTIPGVGFKVADCVMLFSLDKLEAFPLDIWITSTLRMYYEGKIRIKSTIVSSKQYDRVHKEIVDCFGPYAGYAQQFLYKMEREKLERDWINLLEMFSTKS